MSSETFLMGKILRRAQDETTCIQDSSHKKSLTWQNLSSSLLFYWIPPQFLMFFPLCSGSKKLAREYVFRGNGVLVIRTAYTNGMRWDSEHKLQFVCVCVELSWWGVRQVAYLLGAPRKLMRLHVCLVMPVPLLLLFSLWVESYRKGKEKKENGMLRKNRKQKVKLMLCYKLKNVRYNNGSNNLGVLCKF